ncbi:DUF368 domain-containing protein [Saccharophagus degradans]|uniref:DUF368 domain-containing protein n=1 Tax=Saccharophagus degradans TaxID=86304 RepID=UPI002477EF98|nr:DUF368 domain-containing protein [Saccharophagus degradans]WGO97295.1 DUF368 domain-containing protein [Saccharophagus degradans]
MSEQRTKKDYALIALKGMAMGAADVVPGVSGGTIAFITGIYDELLGSLKKIGPEAVVVLFKQGIPAAWKHVNGNFLAALFVGVLLSIKTFAGIVGYCLEHYPLLVWGFFSGLILASVVQLYRHETHWKWLDLVPFLCGVAFVVAIAMAKPAHLPGHNWVLFLGGFVAICAMILPGISGSFILLLVGLYPVFLAAINEFNIIALGAFAAGCACGLMVFSRILSWLLARFRRTTFATLLGFLVGSLYVTWPWKVVNEFVINRHGEQIAISSSNVLPNVYTASTGNTSLWAMVVFCAIIGLFLVLFIELLAKKMKAS